ncbi:histidine-type phosphatase [Klebsiella pneumoniae]|nr:histidine-type phosphatase [Klebsiella pneumoniae]
MKAYTLSLIALALTSSLAQAATADLVLDKVVTLNRHGIRPQMDTAKIQAMSPETFPHFQGKDGELTMHGYAAVTRMGDYLRDYLQQRQFLKKDSCLNADDIFVRTSAKQRTRMTAYALIDTLFPGCGVKVSSPASKKDTLFKPIDNGVAPLDVARASNSVLQKMGGSLEAAKQRYAGDIAAMQKIVDPNCKGDQCTYSSGEWSIKNLKDRNIELEGPLFWGNELGETFRLQYAEGLPLEQVAFGHVKNTDDLTRLNKLHQIKFDLILHDPYIAARAGSQLLSQILYTLEKGSGFHDPNASPEIVASAPDARMVMYFGHDSNLTPLQTLLNVSWHLKGYPKDDTPPGSTLMFERYRDSKTHQTYIGLTFMTQSLDQMRRLEPLNVKNPPLQQKLNLHCKNSPDGWLCPIDEFAAQINSRLDKTAMIAQNYAE